MGGKGTLVRKNGNGKLSKSDHKELCGLIQEGIQKRLDSGDLKFRDIMSKIDDNHKETVEYILELTEKVGAK